MKLLGVSERTLSCHMSTVELVPMQRTDAECEIAFSLKRDALGPHIAAKWGWDESFQRAIHAQRWSARSFFRIVRDGMTIGTVAIDEARDHVRVGEFYLAPQYQNQGIGSEVFRSILHKAERRSLPVRLECLRWNRALSFYKRHGFIVTGETEIHFLMERHPKTMTANNALEQTRPE
jgi:GNAT superfamily N-acetyltransferase